MAVLHYRDPTTQEWVPIPTAGPAGPAGPTGAASTVPGPTGATGPGGVTVMAMNDLTDADTTTVAPSVDAALTWNGAQWAPKRKVLRYGMRAQNNGTQTTDGVAAPVAFTYAGTMFGLTSLTLDTTPGQTGLIIPELGTYQIQLAVRTSGAAVAESVAEFQFMKNGVVESDKHSLYFKAFQGASNLFSSAVYYSTTVASQTVGVQLKVIGSSPMLGNVYMYVVSV